MHTYMSLQGVCVSSRGFLFGGLSGRFRLGWFLSVHPSVRIHPLQQKTKHHFQFLVLFLLIFFKKPYFPLSWAPPPRPKLSPLLGPRSPLLERDVLYGR